MNKNQTFILKFYDDNADKEIVKTAALSSEVVDWVHDKLYSFDPYAKKSMSEDEKLLVSHDMMFFDVPTILNKLRHFDFRGGLISYVLNLPGRHQKIVIEMEVN